MNRAAQIREDVEHDESMHPSTCGRECCAEQDGSFWWDVPERRDPRPCLLCWAHECGLGGMQCIDAHEPDGGFAPVHPECQAAVDEHMREAG